MEKSMVTTSIQNLFAGFQIREEIDQVFRRQGYNWKARKYIEIKRTILMKMAIYLVARQHIKDVPGLNDREVADLQLTIKCSFVVSSVGDYKSKAGPYFLQNLAVHAQLLSSILAKVALLATTSLSPTEIFITLVFVATDKLLSEKCYATILQRLKVKGMIKLNSNRSKKTLGSAKGSLQIIRHSDHLCEFQKELRQNLHPKAASKVESNFKQLITSNNTVLFAKSRFTHQGRKTYYQNVRAFHEKVMKVQTLKIARSYSEGTLKTKTPVLTATKPPRDKGNAWSNFQMLSSFYPLDPQLASATPPKLQKQRINWCKEVSQIKQKQRLIIKQQPNRLTRGSQ